MWTGSRPSLHDYALRNASQRAEIMKAAFVALQERYPGACHALEAPSFERWSQRVRLPDAALAGWMRPNVVLTCLDVALLYLGLLEACGLQAVYVQAGQGKNRWNHGCHALVASWLRDVPIEKALISDFSGIERHLRGTMPGPGVADEELPSLLVCNITELCKGMGFVLACESGHRFLRRRQRFSWALDLGLARELGINPLPIPVGAAGNRPSLATPADGRTVTNFPDPPDHAFYGRNELLDKLHSVLQSHRIVVLWGSRGIGKTRLALEYGEKHADRFRIRWKINARDPGVMPEDYAVLAERLEIIQAGARDEDVVLKLKKHLSKRDDWLLIFDDVDEARWIEEFLPDGDGRVLVTTLSRSVRGMSGFELEVPVLTEQDSADFLLQHTRYKARRTENDADLTTELAKELCCLPVALVQAANYILKQGVSFDRYLKWLREQTHELWSKEPSPADYPAPFARSVRIAITKARETDLLAVKLLNVCAFLAPEAIPYDLFTKHHEVLPDDLAKEVKSSVALHDLTSILRKYILIDIGDDSFSLLRFMQAIAREALPPDEHVYWLRVAVALLEAACKDVSRKSGGLPRELLAHMLATTKYAEPFLKPIGADIDLQLDLLYNTRVLLYLEGRYWKERGHYAKAASKFKEARGFIERAHGSDHPLTSKYLREEFWAWMDQGMKDVAAYDEARKCVAKASERDEQGLRQYQLSKAENLVCQGFFFKDGLVRNYREARANFEQAREILVGIYSDGHPAVARIWLHLGWLSKDEDGREEAIWAFEKSLRSFEAVGATNDPDYASALLGLAWTLKDEGELDRALGLFKKAQDIFQRHQHPDEEIALSAIAQILLIKSEVEGAAKYARDALEVAKQHFYSEHDRVLGAKERLRKVEQSRTSSRQN